MTVNFVINYLFIVCMYYVFYDAMSRPLMSKTSTNHLTNLLSSGLFFQMKCMSPDVNKVMSGFVLVHRFCFILKTYFVLIGCHNPVMQQSRYSAVQRYDNFILL